MERDCQATIVTLLRSGLRTQLETVVGQRVPVVHANSVSEVTGYLARQSVRMIILEPNVITDEDLRFLRVIAKRRIGVSAVAVVASHELRSAERLLDLGASGVRDFVDLGTRDGWHKLRELVRQPAGRVQAMICLRLSPELSGVSFGVRQFFDTLVRAAPRTTTARCLAETLRVDPSTLVSRFFRARLPSPKRYLALTRLVYARALFDTVESTAWVACELGYSSPQSFGRHIRTTLGMTAVEFRTRHTADIVLEHLVGQLVTPYRGVYGWFDPIGERTLAGDTSLPGHAGEDINPSHYKQRQR